MKKLDIMYEDFCNEAEKELETMVRRILKNNKSLDEFIMGMGHYCFTYKNGDTLDTIKSEMNSRWEYVYSDSKAYLKPFNEFMAKWDKLLRLSGEPMRIKHNCKTVKKW